MKMIDEKHRRLIVKCLSGEGSKEEQEQLGYWINSSGENRKLFEDYQKVWDLKPTSADILINKPDAWKKIEKRIATEESNEGPEQARKVKTLPRIFTFVSGIAALLIIAFGIYFLFFSQKSPEIMLVQAGDHSSETILLADNTTVYLNAGAKFYYPEKFTVKERRVRLEGTAFFEVAKVPGNPFFVNAGEAEVKVVGTSFQVLTDSEKNMVEVAVISGSVLLYPAGREDISLTLSAEEVGTFIAKDFTLEKKQLNNKNFLAWKTGILEFDQTPLDQVLRTLEQTYHIEIMNAADISGLRLTARFSYETTHDIFKTLSLLYGVEIEQHGRLVLIK